MCPLFYYSCTSACRLFIRKTFPRKAKMALEKRKSIKKLPDTNDTDENMSSSTELDQKPPPSIHTIMFQFLGLLVSLLSYYLRKSGIIIPIIRWRVEMIGGFMPIECLILSLLILELALRDIYGLCSNGFASG